jgi:hypothetical protein
MGIINKSRSKDPQHCVKKITEKIDPDFEKKFGVTFTAAFTSMIQLGVKSDQIKNTVDTVGEAIASDTNKVILSNNLSYRSMANVRKKNVLEDKKEQTTKRYEIKHDNFLFDREAVKVELGVTPNPVWSHLAERFVVFQQNGKPAMNGGQVLKAYAIDEGLCAPLPDTVRARKVNRRIDVDGVNVSISKLLPHDDKLKGQTKNMILSGEMDIGTPIVPITLHVRKYNKIQKRMVRTEVRLEGRAYSLQSIMDKSLKEQEQEGMLRT